MIKLAITAAREAGAFLKANIGNVRNIQTKDGQERNLVSEIDKASEAMIIGIIKREHPDHSILAEEGGGSEGGSDYKWIIDPLDGTTNYLHNIPIYCVTIGLEYKGNIVAGVVYDPNLDELFTAGQGSGASLNGRPIRVSRTSALGESLLVTGFPYDIATNPDHAIERFVGFLKAARGVRRLGSAALDLCWVAAGRFDAFWEVNLHPWDIAAGLIMVQEAGGTVTDFTESTASVYKKQIVASNSLVHKEMITLLRQAETHL